jgi:hypothetical protein
VSGTGGDTPVVNPVLHYSLNFSRITVLVLSYFRIKRNELAYPENEIHAYIRKEADKYH